MYIIAIYKLHSITKFVWFIIYLYIIFPHKKINEGATILDISFYEDFSIKTISIILMLNIATQKKYINLLSN